MNSLDTPEVDSGIEYNLSVKDAFARDFYRTFMFNNNMGENEEDILKILNEDITEENKHYNFIAGMNSGKTYTMMDIAGKKDLKMVLAVPLILIKDQKVREYQKDNPSSLIGNINGERNKIGGTREAEINTLISKGCKLFVCVFDSIFKLINNERFEPNEYTLVVDEAHDLVTQFGYRYEAIKDLTKYQEQFKRIIYLSGTSEGTLPYNYRSIRFVRNIVSEEDRYKFYLVKYKNAGLWKLFNLLINAKEGNKLILIDNTEVLKQLRIAIMEYYKMDEDTADKKIWILSRKLNDQSAINELVAKQEGVEFILSTRIIGGGVNIYGRMDSVYMLDVDDFWLKRQFIARCRDSIRIIYDLISYKKNYPSLWKSANRLYIEEEVLAKKFNNLINQELKQNNDLTRSETIYDDQKCFKYSYYDEELKKYQISNESIRYSIIKTYNYKMAHNPKMAIEYYGDIAKYEAEFILYDDLINNLSYDTIDKEEFDTISKNGNQYDLTELFSTKLDFIYTIYLENEKSENLKNRIIDSSMLYQFSLSEEVVADYKSVLKQEKKLLSMINVFAIEGYPREFIEQLVQKYRSGQLEPRMTNKLREQLGYYFDRLAIYYYPEIIQLFDDFDELRDYEIPYFFYERYKGINKINITREYHETTEFIASIFNKSYGNMTKYNEIIESIFKCGNRYPDRTQKYSDEKSGREKYVYWRKIAPLKLDELLEDYNIHLNSDDAIKIRRVIIGRLLIAVKNISDMEANVNTKVVKLIKKLNSDLVRVDRRNLINLFPFQSKAGNLLDDSEEISVELVSLADLGVTKLTTLKTDERPDILDSFDE